MKKFLLPAVAVFMSGAFFAAQAEDPVFPDSFDVEVTPSLGLTVTQGEEDEAFYVITVSGETTADFITVQLGIPDGWTGFIGSMDTDEMEHPIEPMHVRAKMSATEWVPVDAMLAYGLRKTDYLKFPIDGDEHNGQMYLYLGEEADGMNMIMINVQVTKKKEVEAPVFPETFDLEITPSEGLTVTQGEDDGVYIISISGETTSDEVSVQFALPEGWTGFVGKTDADESEHPIMPLNLSAYALEPFWVPLEELKEEGYKTTDFFKFPVDGDPHSAQVFLYFGEDVDVNNFISLELNISKTEVEGPAFPESFAVELNPSEGLTLTQGEDQGVYTIKVEGKVAEDVEEISVTVAVPEGWTGLIGTTDLDEMEHPTEPLRLGAYTPEEPEWIPVDAMLEAGLKKTNTFTFPTDGEDHTGSLYLYLDDMADCVNMISLEVNVSKDFLEGVALVAGEEDAHYFDMLGVEVENPSKGIFVKVVNGKASKVVIK